LLPWVIAEFAGQVMRFSIAVISFFIVKCKSDQTAYLYAKTFSLRSSRWLKLYYSVGFQTVAEENYSQIKEDYPLAVGFMPVFWCAVTVKLLDKAQSRL